LECLLAHASCDGDDTLELWDRRLALLEAHGESWLAPLAGIAESTHLERGLVERVLLGSMKALTFGNSWTIDTASLRRLTRWPGLAALDRLTFVLSGLSDEQLEILATSPWLGDWKSLRLSETRVTDDGVERFCRSPAWRALEELGTDRNSRQNVRCERYSPRDGFPGSRHLTSTPRTPSATPGRQYWPRTGVRHGCEGWS
jgi:hypothetical protein